MSKVGKSGTSEAMVKFLKERVESNQGISLQKLTGHLSQLPPDLRTKYGCSVKSLKLFLQQYPKVFVIRNQSNVYVRTKKLPSPAGSIESVMTTMSDRGTNDDADSEDVTTLIGVKGQVYRIFNVYGFISIKNPITTSVYFDVQAFENGEHSNLPASGLQLGEGVLIDAKMGPNNCEAKFRASRVVRIKNHGVVGPPPSLSSACSSPTPHSKQTIEEHGFIETVKGQYGFIKFGRNLRERAFFHLNNVDRAHGKTIRNLPDVLTVEDRVRFKAKPSKKSTDKVKWEATVVYIPLLSKKAPGGISDSDDESGNEVFMSDDESDIVDFLQDKLNGAYDDPAVGYADWDSGSATTETPPRNDMSPPRNGITAGCDWDSLRKLSGEKGRFVPRTDLEGEIRFGRDQRALASADVTYRGKEQVDNLLWEVTDNQEVTFDAVDATGNDDWITTLAWTDVRPPHKPHVNDSEEVFRSKCQTMTRRASPLAGDRAVSPYRFEARVSPVSRSVAPSISINESARGTVSLVMECMAFCDVEATPGGAKRKIQFTSDCFYRDGQPYPGDLTDVLAVGDAVSLDYMVGIGGGADAEERVHCDVVWQGRRPADARQLSPEDFCRQLGISEADGQEGVPSFEDFEREIQEAQANLVSSQEVPSDKGAMSSKRNSEGDAERGPPVVPSAEAVAPNEATATHVGARRRLPDCVVLPKTQNGAVGHAPTMAVFSSDVSDEVLRRLARMVAEQLSAHQPHGRATLRDVGTQTVEEYVSLLARAEGAEAPLVNSSTQTLSTGGIKSEELFIN
ncbi:hypothetical protein ISCGN_024781 [Ixodes scapularis]|uniref:Egal-1 winged helix domain-containing protein n=1 Tax=Ixodes scapularis TaxID=6945 RepID=B7PGU6_IXOSC|nr:hypothetical protein IscW_ISCW018317 [Ixodes scapularis]|eukprot:XP_002401455.1 hypothetical protein IscW_ISCW018317 [Ixodes scapularis]